MTAPNTKVFGNFKEIIKFPIRHEGDGQDFEVEIRDDQDQLVKLQEIIDILVAAGYFRARIKGLSAFDKVVGGMTWCIELCKIDIDVDLLFQENSTIGQKIALTEKIVAVLPKLKCPHAIEPHQIQGLDFIHIYPVVQWLVKLSMENRQEMSSFVRSYAVNQFNKQFQIEPETSISRSKMLDSLNIVQEIYRPHRYFKRKTASPPNLESRVQITLLEYGHTNESRGSHICNSDEHGLGNEDIEQEFIHYEELNTEEKENVNKHYTLLNSELKDGIVKSSIRNKSEILEEKRKMLIDECNKLEVIKLAKNKELEKSVLSSKEIMIKQQESENALKELQNAEDNNSEKLEEIEKLVILSDSLRAKEIQFKEQCKSELIELQQLLENAKASKLKTVTETSPHLKEIDEETEKVSVLRLQLAKKNRHVYALQRKLDEVPSRAELAQYQKRFMELYNQVSAKHKETKQYYTLYNTLVDTRLYMQKQLSLLNSISENYPEAMKTSKGKEEFITQFQNILDGVRQSKIRVKQKLREEKEERDNLSISLQSLLEQQRKYVAALRQLSVECRKHEVLLNKKHNSPQKDN